MKTAQYIPIIIHKVRALLSIIVILGGIGASNGLSPVRRQAIT